MLFFGFFALIEFINDLEKKNTSTGLCLILRIMILGAFVALSWDPLPFLYLASDYGS
jgi:hypothetical protein